MKKPCPRRKMARIRANFAGKPKFQSFRGRKHAVFPVVMLRETVVNGAFVPLAELMPEAWNGVPVTLHHPVDQAGPISANSPEVLEKYEIGTIFGAALDGDKLKAEAWIDVAQAERKAPGLIAAIASGEAIDVSTGYFPQSVPGKGSHKGKAFLETHRELKPDHLAFLPGDEGACSWQDGCGIRANGKRKETPMSKPNLMAALMATLMGSAAIKTNEGEETREDLAAALIANPDSPYDSDDLPTLLKMPDDVFAAVIEAYLSPGEIEEVIEEGEILADQAEDGDDDKEKEVAANANKKVGDLKAGVFVNMISGAVVKGLTQAAEVNERAQIVGNLGRHGIKAADLKGLPTATLRKLLTNADALKAKPKGKEEAPTANRQGQPLQRHSGGGNKETAPSMVPAPMFQKKGGAQ